MSCSLYDIDGIVVAKDIVEANKHNSNPKQTVAFKVTLDTDSKPTNVTDVQWNITKDGYLKPVVVVETVSIDGCNISKITGNNAKYMFTNKIGKGARVEVIRSGHVIPKIIKVLKPWEVNCIPKVDCVWNTTNTDLIAKDISNKPQLLLYFIKTIGIKYINVSLCDHLVDAGIDTPELLCSVTKEMLSTLPNMGEKSVNKIYNSIHHYMAHVEPIKIIVAVNIIGRNMGINRLQLVVDTLGILKFVDNMEVLDKDTILTIPGFSDNLTTQLVNGMVKVKHYFTNNVTISSYFNKSVVKFQHSTPIIKSNSCQDINVVFTGFRDMTLETFITANGGKISNSISKNISHLVIKNGDVNKSSKVDKAETLGICIISVDTFKEHLSGLT